MYRNRRTDDLSFNNDGIVSASQMSGERKRVIWQHQGGALV